MTTIEFILIIIAVLIMLAGVILFMRGIQSSDISNAQKKLPEGVQQKDGLPVLPREMREFEEPKLDSEIEQEQALQQASNTINQANTISEESADEKSSTTFDATRVDTNDAQQDASTQDANDTDTTSIEYEPIYFPDVPADDDIIADTAFDSHETQTFARQSYNDKSVDDLELDIKQNMANDSNNDVSAATSMPLAAATVAHMAQTNSDGTTLEANQPESTKIEQNDSMLEQAETSDINNNNSPVLDKQLETDNEIKQNSPLYNAEFNLNISILPNNEFTKFSGIQLLKLADNYGFKFGEMNMFHRYQQKDGAGMLWFSMMGLGIDGVKPFDLNTLANDEFKGLILFLPLPHPKVFQGFDSMMSIASLIARELDGYMVDENGVPINTSYKKKLRAQLEEVYGE
ncbi:MAG: hypothetical protein CSA42_06230 [Gammaproteobacteria bacterium]|nr:MAG: hypothetical protein CSA42_06230 [Gammaproteobacteria bacterium]